MSSSQGPLGCLLAALVFLVPFASSAQQDVAPAAPQLIGVSPASPEDAAANTCRFALPGIRSSLAAGDWPAARRAMLQMAVLISQSQGLRGLEIMKQEILDATDPPGLMAMSLLLFDVYREALESRQYLVSTTARGIAFACLERLEHAPGIPRALVADFYTLIGCQLQAAGAVSVSRDSFRRAVDLDPQLGPAWLGLGIYLEHLGHGEDAIEVFGKVPEVQPYYGEASLRKALTQIRLGHERNARKSLEALVDASAPSQSEPWVQSVAFQELGMLELRRSGPAAAREVLQQAVKRLPHDGRLYLLLAFVHNTMGQRAAAAKVLENMEREAVLEADASPRHRLAEWRVAIPAGLEERLRQQAERSVTRREAAP